MMTAVRQHGGMSATDQIRSRYKFDAAYEAVLGLGLTLGTAVGWGGHSAMPLSRGVILGLGVSFLAASLSSVVYFAPRAPFRVLLKLALGNAAMAVGALGWLIADHRFSAIGRLVLGTFVVWKTAIASLQLAGLRAGASGREDAGGRAEAIT